MNPSLNFVESPSNSDPEWPSGTYGLPRPRLGCPRSDKVTWSSGWRFQDTEDSNADNRKSESFHMGAIVMKNDVNRSFCIATENKGARMWPKGERKINRGFTLSPQVESCKILSNKEHHSKEQLRRFHLICHALGFHPQTQKLEPPCTA